MRGFPKSSVPLPCTFPEYAYKYRGSSRGSYSANTFLGDCSCYTNSSGFGENLKTYGDRGDPRVIFSESLLGIEETASTEISI